MFDCNLQRAVNYEPDAQRGGPEPLVVGISVTPEDDFVMSCVKTASYEASASVQEGVLGIALGKPLPELLGILGGLAHVDLWEMGVVVLVYNRAQVRLG